MQSQRKLTKLEELEEKLNGANMTPIGAHTLQEHILVDSLPQRAKLLTGLLMELS